MSIIAVLLKMGFLSHLPREPWFDLNLWAMQSSDKVGLNPIIIGCLADEMRSVFRADPVLHGFKVDIPVLTEAVNGQFNTIHVGIEEFYV